MASEAKRRGILSKHLWALMGSLNVKKNFLIQRV
jgi:hypothetical protein